MNEYKLLVQRIGLIGLANVLVNLSGLFLLPILTKSLPVEDYGIWAQVNVTISLVSSITLLGLSASLLRYMSASSRREDIRECFYSILSVVALTGISVMLLVFYLAGPIADNLFGQNIAVVRLLSVIIFIESLNSLLFNCYRALQRMKIYALLSIVMVYLTILLAYLFVKSGLGIYGAVLGLAASKLIIFIILFSILFVHIGFGVPKFGRLREYISFGLPIVPASVFDWIVNSSDRYVIGILLGTAWVGYYSPAYLLGSLISIFINPLGIVLPVALYRYYDKGDMASVENLLGLTIKYFLALAIPAVFGLTLLSKSMLTVLSTQDIAEHSYLITPFVAVGMLFVGVASVMSNVIYLVKKTTVSMKISFMAAVINLSLTLILVHQVGILGAALATLVTFGFSLVCIFYFANQFVRVAIDYAFILKCFSASFVMSLPILLWQPEGLIEILRTVISSIGIYLLVLFLMKGIKRDEMRFILSLFSWTCPDKR